MDMINSYLVGDTLGEGTYGKVKLGIHSTTQEKVAIKFIKDVAQPKHLAREVEIMKLLSHPNVVKLHDVTTTEGENGKQTTILVMEYIEGGELFDYILSNRRLSEKESVRLFRQMISALKYCHQHLVIHRDLKPENILLDKNQNIKITDFGFSNVMRPGMLFQSRCGSALYSSPEILLGTPYIGPEVDIWALGVILYAMVTGCIPWYGPDLQSQVASASVGKYIHPANVSDACANLISRMLTPDPSKRATLTELFMHPWVNKGSRTPLSSALTYHAPPRKEDIDSDILDDMEKMGFDREKVVKSLMANNMMENCVGIYYLMIKNKQTKGGGVSHTPEPSKKVADSPSKTDSLRIKDKDRRDIASFLTRSASFSGSCSDVSDATGSDGSTRSPPAKRRETNAGSPSVSPASPSNKFFNLFKRKKAQDNSGSVMDSLTNNSVTNNTSTNNNNNTNTRNHNHTNDEVIKLRTVKVNANTSIFSRKPLSSITTQLESMLSQLQISFKKDVKKGLVYSCKDEGKKIKFEIEVCAVSVHPEMKTVVHTRKKGDLIAYKQVLAQLELHKLMTLSNPSEGKTSPQ